MKSFKFVRATGYLECALGGWVLANDPLKGVIIVILGGLMVAYSVKLEEQGK